MGGRNHSNVLWLPMVGCRDCLSCYTDVIKMDVSIVWMVLNGWFAKMSFEQEAPTTGWICLFVSAWYLARVMQAIIMI